MKKVSTNKNLQSKVYRGGKEKATQAYSNIRRGADDIANKGRRMNANLYKEPTNIIITGVGGQGNVMASRVLAGMLVNAGYIVTIGETFGMSQRGGSVMSHLRVSSTSVLSPQIPQGRADIIIALEPVEALRVLVKYGNPDVAVLSNSRMVYPMGVITGDFTYPSLDEIKSMFEKLAAKSWLIDATSVAVDLGNPVLSNIVMIGALAGTLLLPVDRRAFEKEITKSISADKRGINLTAFDAGAKKIL
ncbi:MAG: indolepyruvate oxidoreductase subunit beta [Smithella sp.]